MKKTQSLLVIWVWGIAVALKQPTADISEIDNG